MHFTKEEIEKTERVQRLNIINSISGIKPANLIGTRSDKGVENLAIFSSVVHLGSNPALLGFISRPSDEVRRHTYENIKATGYYTINHIAEHFTEKAHYTSAKFDADESEFERCQLEPTYLGGFHAPYVEESPIKIGMHFLEEIPIKRNGTVLMIGEVSHLYIQDDLLNEKGYIDFEKANAVGISGLNSYYQLKKKADYPYARVSEIPDFTKKASDK